MAFRPAREPAAVRASSRPEELLAQPTVELVLFHDVLCAWSYIADQRIGRLCEEYGSVVRLRYRGHPLRADEALDKKQRMVLARHFRRAAKEKEGAGVVADLWTGNDPPRSSLPPLLALEAALLQGPKAQRALLQALRQAAFLRGMNVSRRDVLLELAESVGLEVGPFLRALDDPRTAAAVQAGVEEAEALEIKGVPALVVNDEWLMQGCRDLDEYRRLIGRALTAAQSGAQARVLH